MHESKIQTSNIQKNWFRITLFITTLFSMAFLLVAGIIWPAQYNGLKIGLAALSFILVIILGSHIINRFRKSSNNKQTYISNNNQGQMLRALLNAPTETAILMDAEAKVLAINKIAADRFGKGTDEMVGKSIHDFLPSDLAESRRTKGKQVFETGKPCRFIDEHENRTFDTNIYPVLDNNGIVTAIAIYSRDITESVKAKHEIERSEDQFRTLFQNAPIIIFNLTADGKILEFNPEAGKLIGWDRVDIIGKNYIDLFIPENKRDEVRQDIKKVLTGSPTRSFENPIILPDGSKRFMIWNVDPVYNSEGTATGIIAVGYDNTEHKLAEEALRKSEEKFSVTFRSNPCPVVISSLKDNRIIDVNDSFVQLSGHKREEAIGRTAEELNLWYKPEQRKDLIKRLRKDGSAYNMDYMYQTKTGMIRFGLLSSEIIEIENEPCLLATFMDITERKNAEQALKENEERFRRLANNAQDMIYRMSLPDGNYEYVSPASINIWGYTPEEVYRSPLLIKEIIHPDWKDQFQEEWSNLLSGDMPPFYEYKIIKKSGEECWLNQRNVLVCDDAGKPIAIEGFVTDVTDRKKTLEELAKYKNLLEAVISQSPVPMVVASVDGTLEIINDACKEQLKTEDESEVKAGMNLFDFTQSWKDFDSQGRPIDVKDLPLAKALRGVVTKSEEIHVIRKDGSERWELVDGFPIYNKTGEIIAGVIIFPDITDRKIAIEALRESEQRLQDITQNIPGMVYQFRVRKDGTYYFSYASSMAQTMYGLPEDLDAEEWKSFQNVHPDDQERLFSSIDDSVKNVCEWNHEYRLLMPNGEIRWMHGISSPSKIGEELVYNGVLFDVTERKQAEEESRNRESILSSIFRASPVGIGLVENRIIKQVNNRTCEMIGYREEELINNSARILYPSEEEYEYVGTEKYRQISELGTGTVETRWRKKDGQIIDVLLSSTPIDEKDLAKGVTFTALDITDRKRVENEIIKEKTFSDGLMRSLPGIFYFFGEDGMMQRWNRLFEEVTGYTHDEISRMNALEFFEEHERPLVQSRIVEVFEEGQSSVEAGFRTKSGKNIAHYFTGTRLESDGKIYLVGVGIDISESKRVNEALRESEEKARKFIESSPMGMHMYQLDSAENLIFTGANPAADNILGIDHEQFIGKTLEEAFPGLVGSEIPDRYKRIATQGEKWHTEHIQYDKSSIKGVYEVHAFQISPGKMAALFFDITERKEADNRLREAQALLFSSIEQSPAGIIIADAPDVNIRIANSAALGIRSESEVPLVNISAELHPQNWQVYHLNGDLYEPQELPLSRAVMEGITSRDLELKIRRTNGEERLLSVNAAPIRNREGEIIAGVAVFADITETRRLQKLENRAQRLQTAGQIAGQVAHDFNNLLGPLMAYPELMRDTLPEGHESAVLLDSIEQAAKKMADINQQLLALGRRGHYDLKPININGIILNAIREMKPLPKTLACELDLDESLMNVMGGNAQVYRVILNLLHNARDAMLDIGRLSIKTENYYIDDTATVFSQIPIGEYVKMTITDSGCGIPAENIDRIFDPFYTSKTTDRKRGSGLGLSVVDAVIKDHNGHIDVSSKIGEGTSFYVYLPISREAIEKHKPETFKGGSETVLIVDDDEIQRNVSMRILTKLGYNVSIASSGEEAVRICRQTPQDILVLDMVMPPGIDGAETYRRILNYNANQKAVIVSGFSETERVIEAQNLGAGAFVKKPLTTYTIASALRNELDKKPESRANR